MTRPYLIHRASKSAYPTRVVMNGFKGTHVLGRDSARKAIEDRIGRRLAPGTIARDNAGEWIFREPRPAHRADQGARHARHAKRAAVRLAVAIKDFTVRMQREPSPQERDALTGWTSKPYNTPGGRIVS